MPLGDRAGGQIGGGDDDTERNRGTELNDTRRFRLPIAMAHGMPKDEDEDRDGIDRPGGRAAGVAWASQSQSNIMDLHRSLYGGHHIMEDVTDTPYPGCMATLRTTRPWGSPMGPTARYYKDVSSGFATEMLSIRHKLDQHTEKIHI